MDVHEIHTQNQTAQFVFTMTDTGIGMQPEFLSQIFTAFSRERDSRVDTTEGTGLGMAITKKIVDLLGGAIEVESAPGEGTTFRVSLPLEIVDAPLFEGKFPNLNIIVVDDDAMMCEYTVEMLHNIGVHADWVLNGTQAVKKIRQAQQNGKGYDAVFLDWKMPGQDGLETTRQIRELRNGSLPILIISAYDWNDIEEEAEQAGVSGFLQKPIFTSTLIRGLQRYVLGEQPVADKTERLQQEQFQGKRFLLFEDNQLNQEVAKELLGDMGAKIDIACNGEVGLNTFKQTKPGYYHMILMDIQMPVMDVTLRRKQSGR